MPILPPLSEMLINEQKRHHDEVARINKFHKFISEFEKDGCIAGKSYKLNGISITALVASFKGADGSDYFFDADKAK